ncbi:deoxynucleoside kinase [Paenibacillus sp. N3.4]|uniref:dTMP kinase n=1 Tax=Paenibacillus sp. N3.4 TaxID=2603222 RepID=UPI0011CAE069|nr:deoxynucleoside kinase [Paenibacillus sp. N3.4]TXK77431.1 thymidylate kinase [Paenibacillus sp. N3.4]
MNNNDFIPNHKKGVLVVYEGISGSGKSEGIAKLLHYLNTQDFSPVVIEWNANKAIRSIVKKLDHIGLLTSNVYSLLQWLSFIIDYMFILKPSIWKNKIVIMDRYLYTGITRDDVNGAMTWLGWILCKCVRKPDVVLFYDTSPLVCLDRIRRRGKTLFHTRKKGAEEDTDLTYLEELRGSYHRVFSYLRQRKMNIVFVEEDSVGVHKHIEGFINKKSSYCRYCETNHSLTNQKEKAR